LTSVLVSCCRRYSNSLSLLRLVSTTTVGVGYLNFVNY